MASGLGVQPAYRHMRIQLHSQTCRFIYLSEKGNSLSFFMMDIYYTKWSPDPHLAFQGLNDNEELSLQP